MQGFFFSLISRPSAKLCKQDFFPYFFGPCIPNISFSLQVAFLFESHKLTLLPNFFLMIIGQQKGTYI
jgi:hypothetical protein